MGKRDLIVPATEANRSFSRLLRVVRDGGRVTITAYGEPVAELRAPEQGEAEAEKTRLREAVAALKTHWAETPNRTVGPWTRDSLYDED